MNKNIAGTNVVTDHPDIKKAKSVDDLKKLEIFSHLPEDEQEEAYKALLEENHPKKKEEEVPDENE